MKFASRLALTLVGLSLTAFGAENAKKKQDNRPAVAAPSAEEAARQMADPRMEWFREAKFGMFIHWGLYAIPAGTWKDQQIGGIGEWIMNRAKIPVAEYEQLAKHFNPVKFDAEAWAQLAQDAGMKYLTITSKHHDGFAMFHSKVSKYNIVDATPFQRDPMKELAAACARRGIKFCFYYSQAQDWHEPGGMGNSWDFGNDKTKSTNGEYDQYLADKALPQVREILTQYGPLGLIWFDTPREMTPERAGKFTALCRELQPACLVNGRLGCTGDYRSSGDNKIPDKIIAGLWETPATMNDTWGFKSYDHKWKSAADITFKLVDICAKGGNYLLNVGPTAEGVIPDPCPATLRAVGAWLKVNGAAIYGTRPSPLGDELGGKSLRCTRKDKQLFLHVFAWPANGKLTVPQPKEAVGKAFLLSDPNRAPLKFTAAEGKLTIDCPATAPDPVDSVITLELSDPT